MAIRRDIEEGVVGAFTIAGAVLLSPFIRGWYNRWGATDAEIARELPGDARVPTPKLTYTRAITVNASPAEVWAWLIQIGHGRAGMYSYDALENLIGCEMHSADRIVPEWQQVAPGDVVRLGPKGYPMYKVVGVEPWRTFILAGADPVSEQPFTLSEPMPEAYVNSVLIYALEPLDDGNKTRLIVRTRLDYNASIANELLWHIVETLNFVMERKMLLNIKRLSEGRTWRTQHAV